MSRIKKQLIIIAASLLLCIGLAGLVFGGRSKPHTGVQEPEVTKPTEETAQEAEAVFFASDYQIEPGFDTPAHTLNGILKQVKESGIEIDNAVFCGDYTNDRSLHDYQLSPEDSIEEIRGVLKEDCPDVKQDDVVFVQGNHDKLTESITPSGLKEYDDYLIYVVNIEDDFPWKQGRDVANKDKVVNTANEMKACFDNLISRGERRPLFIVGHVPLHFTARTSSRHSTGDNMYSSYIFGVVNEAASDLDIIYMFGHNHSKGWDCYLGGGSVCLIPGEKILIPDAEGQNENTDRYNFETLNFTYVNAGYLGYYMNCGTEELDNGTWKDYEAADGTLTGTVARIYEDEIVITRFSADGRHNISADGEANPYKGGIDKDLIDSEYYGKKREDFSLKRKSLTE